MMGKVFESLQKIQSNYRSHSKDMESMVLESESLSQEYQSNMEDNIHAVCTLFFIKASKSRKE